MRLLTEISMTRAVTIAVSVTALLFPVTAMSQSAETLAEQLRKYEAVEAKTVLDLQPFRTASAVDLADGRGSIVLTSLNPSIGAWFLLQAVDAKGRVVESYHLELPQPAGHSVLLDPDGPALTLSGPDGAASCTPWEDELEAARKTALPYAPVCAGRLYLRNRSRGARTSLEATAEFLRDNIWGGESIVRFVRGTFFKDAELEASPVEGNESTARNAAGPPPMQTEAADNLRPVIGTLLDVAVTGAEDGRMAIGVWYPVTGMPGVFASAFQPGAIARSVFDSPGKVNRLDSVEANATGYMIAFDLSAYDLGFALGTDHPGLGWSPRPAASARPRGLPGPDGIRTADPLVRLGMVNPALANRTIATFTGGFKRQHGAFKFGEMATFNMGHHYGFIENGVILSKLQPGLSTIVVLNDGTVHMKTWQEEDNVLLPLIRFARQNGVALLERDAGSGQGVPGELVTQWGGGNWSGSADAELRTLRAGACIVEDGQTNYLVYGYFSTATPSAMVRTFQAYGCGYAMLMDMNALEHTYLALYVPRGGKIHVAHIVPGMGLIDKKLAGGKVIPRFIGYPDNRDLFYVMRKEVVK
ncbi:hypothetical protein [Ruegeria marina]|uniref:Uncharacterized protein n=1 Tax=Ruegeria marina TaxID=639004 RepID=A0A1G7E2R2_9RHOB|nr:hypothetical protein [Ruegeria marina]SDE57766.1 hypothetical protein SAMN04488239_12340 [Ruegeria marina]